MSLEKMVWKPTPEPKQRQCMTVKGRHRTWFGKASGKPRRQLRAEARSSKSQPMLSSQNQFPSWFPRNVYLGSNFWTLCSGPVEGFKQQQSAQKERNPPQEKSYMQLRCGLVLIIHTCLSLSGQYDSKFMACNRSWWILLIWEWLIWSWIDINSVWRVYTDAGDTDVKTLLVLAANILATISLVSGFKFYKQYGSFRGIFVINAIEWKFISKVRLVFI